jgi:hypothetical protein
MTSGVWFRGGSGAVHEFLVFNPPSHPVSLIVRTQGRAEPGYRGGSITGGVVMVSSVQLTHMLMTQERVEPGVRGGSGAVHGGVVICICLGHGSRCH